MTMGRSETMPQPSRSTRRLMPSGFIAVPHSSLQVLDPEIPKKCFVRASALELNRKHTVVYKHRRVIVDEHRHEMPVNGIDHRSATSDQVDLVPLADQIGRASCR